MASNDSNLIAALLADHHAVKELFGRFEVTGTSQAELFCELTNELVRHEVAEEQVVYPEVRSVLPNRDQLANARIAEQSKAEGTLADIEKMDASSPAFIAKLTQLRVAVLAHAEKEEREVFAPLCSSVDLGRLELLGGAYEEAKAAARTHPHPHAPDTPPGNLVSGPVAALADQVRDAIRFALRGTDPAPSPFSRYQDAGPGTQSHGG